MAEGKVSSIAGREHVEDSFIFGAADKKKHVRRIYSKLKKLESTESEFQTEGDRNNRLYAEWTSVHDKIQHREQKIIDGLKAKLFSSADKKSKAEFREGCLETQVLDETQNIAELHEDLIGVDAILFRRVDGSNMPGVEGKQEGTTDALDEQIVKTVCAHSHHFKFFSSTCWHSGGYGARNQAS